MPSKGTPIPERLLTELASNVLRHVVPVDHVAPQSVLARDAFTTEDTGEGKPRTTAISLISVSMLVDGVGITG